MEKALLTIEELSAKIGVKAATLHRWKQQQRIPYVKLGRLLRFSVADIDAWLTVNQHQVESFTTDGDVGEQQAA